MQTVLLLVVPAAGAWASRIVLSRAAQTVLQWLLADRPSQKYNGLDSLVSFSSCLIAARRAVESELPDAYIHDYLARGLCGKEALEGARQEFQRHHQQQQQQASQTAVATVGTGPPGKSISSSATGGRRPIARLIMRTLFFDDVVRVATWRSEGPGAGPAAVPCHVPLLRACSAAPCLQVVLLGAGLDARPWRLALPPGVSWFEVDRSDVLRAKKRRLRELGAQLTHGSAWRGPGTTRGSSLSGAALTHGSARPVPLGHGEHSGEDSNAAGQQQGQQQGQVGQGYPLWCASWTGVALDLCHAGWARQLVRAGLDPARPVLWVLEGLLYYFDQAQVEAILKEAASVSCPGSILAASILCTPPPASAPHNTPAPAPPVATGGAAASAGAGVAPPAGTATTGDAAGPTAAGASGREGRGDACNGVAGAGLQPHGQAAESEAGAGKLETEESRPAAGAATAAAGSGSVQAVRWKLNAEFKWRCQGPPEQFFGRCLWRSVSCATWTDTARSYGLTPEPATRASGVTFLVAERA